MMKAWNITDRKNHPALFYHKSGDKIICNLCNHRCQISNGKTGICKTRKVEDGNLHTLTYGYFSAEAIDPVEKKPLYHFLPGTDTYSLGSVGCNFHCLFCQNWHISMQGMDRVNLQYISPEEGVQRALDNHVSSISWTYNEPSINFEYTIDMAKIAHQNGLKTIYVTNGYMSKEVLLNLVPFIDAMRIDLKSMDEMFYQKICGASLQPVLDNIALAVMNGIHVEIINLVIPGFNDSKENLSKLIDWVLKNTGPMTPLHFTRFHPDYKLTESIETPIKTLEYAYTLAKSAGLNYPYIGNVMNHQYENTYCHSCGELLIKRSGFSASVFLTGNEKNLCPKCFEKIPVITGAVYSPEL